MVKKPTGRQHWHSTLTYLGCSRYESDRRFSGARSALQDAEEVRRALERGGLVFHAANSRVASTVQRHLAVDRDGHQVAVVEVSVCSKAACALEPAVPLGGVVEPSLTLEQDDSRAAAS
jgi:hypothetical protein